MQTILGMNFLTHYCTTKTYFPNSKGNKEIMLWNNKGSRKNFWSSKKKEKDKKNRKDKYCQISGNRKKKSKNNRIISLQHPMLTSMEMTVFSKTITWSTLNNWNKSWILIHNQMQFLNLVLAEVSLSSQKIGTKMLTKIAQFSQLR